MFFKCHKSAHKPDYSARNKHAVYKATSLFKTVNDSALIAATYNSRGIIHYNLDEFNIAEQSENVTDLLPNVESLIADNTQDSFTFASGNFSDIVHCYTPNSSSAYADIEEHISDWIEEAIRIRNQYK